VYLNYVNKYNFAHIIALSVGEMDSREKQIGSRRIFKLTLADEYLHLSSIGGRAQLV
jgi:hypothetical protein